MVPARHNPARKDESVQLSAMFAEAGWEPADQHFRERPFVIWHGSFYSASGTPPNGSPCSKSCQTAEEVLAFLEQKTAEGIPERTAKPETLTLPTRSTINDIPSQVTFSPPEVRSAEVEKATQPVIGWDEPRIKAIEARLDALEARSSQLAERDAEPPPLSPDPVKHMIPEEIRKLMQGDETLPQARQRLWPILNAELGELKNQEALFNKTIPRRAEVEQLISILARLGEG